MDAAVLYALLFVVLLGIAVLVGLRLVAGRRRKPPLPPQPGVDYTPGVGEDAYPSAEPTVTTLEEIPLPEQAGAPAIELERPAPTKGRLERLRARLARSNSDWYRLLDMCALSHTLIADNDGLYDPRQYNDR